MAFIPTRRPRGRRLRIAVSMGVLLGAGILFLATPPGSLSVSAAHPRVTPTCPLDERPCGPPPTCDFLLFDQCQASPSPSIVVISPVPLDSPSPPGIPSYLIGNASPSPSPGADTGGSPVPLGGAFGDLPTPSAGAVSSTSDNGSRGGGPPLPLLFLGFLFLVGSAGAVIYAVAPLGDRFPEKTPEPPGVMLAPYGPDTPSLNPRRPPASS